jgi:hypothetical protein
MLIGISAPSLNSNSEAVWPLLQPTEEVLDSPFGNELKTGDDLL